MIGTMSRQESQAFNLFLRISIKLLKSKKISVNFISKIYAYKQLGTCNIGAS